MTELLAVIDGESHPLLDCFWGMFAPCGCLSGATVTGFGDMPQHGVKATEEAAWASMYDSAPERERDEKAGFTFRLITRDTYKALTMKCEHDPKWGVPAIPKPEGMTWALTVGSRRPAKTVRLHLVPDDVVNLSHAERWADGPPAKVTALCAKKSSDERWKSEWPDVDGQIECGDCIAAANNLIGAN